MKEQNPHHERIRAELITAKESLTQASRHLDEGSELAVLDDGLKNAAERRDLKSAEALKAGERIKDWFEHTKDQVIDKIEDLKTDIEIHRIEKDADRKEEHACDAVVVAAHALLEAEIALIEALKARRLAIDVAG